MLPPNLPEMSLPTYGVPRTSRAAFRGVSLARFPAEIARPLVPLRYPWTQDLVFLMGTIQ